MFWRDYMLTDKYKRWHKSTLLKDSLRFNLLINELFLVGDKLRITDRLHPHWKLLYELVWAIKPKSIYEVGFGAGNHLINLQTVSNIYGGAQIGGCELNQLQYQIGCDLFQLQEKKLELVVGNYMEVEAPPAEFVFDTTVVMHLPTDMVKPFIKKMVDQSTKHCLILDWYYEGHNYYDLMTYIREMGVKVDQFDTNNLREHRKVDGAASYGFFITK